MNDNMNEPAPLRPDDHPHNLLRRANSMAQAAFEAAAEDVASLAKRLALARVKRDEAKATLDATARALAPKRTRRGKAKEEA